MAGLDRAAEAIEYHREIIQSGKYQLSTQINSSHRLDRVTDQILSLNRLVGSC
jgi:hypothetical protein